jgi:molybdenum cofactor cytidylyltransferase
MISFATIILAAGASSRMGRPKMLLPWRDTTVIGHLIDQWRKAGAGQIGVVRSVDDTALDAELNRIGFAAEDRILNPEPARGMFSSIQCAARWNGWKETLTHWAIALGDQPHLPVAMLRTVSELAAKHPNSICQPSRNHRPRHPVFLPCRVFQALADATQATLKEFLEIHSADRTLLEINDPRLDLDMDEPADYERALRSSSAQP